MTMTLYHCHQSRSMRCLWLMQELGLDFELKVMPFGRELRHPDYLAVHPLGRVPCLVDGDLTLFESLAIIQYLCETYDDGTFGRSAGHPERVEWLQWLHYAETVLIHGQMLTQQYVVIEDETQRSPLLQKLETRRLEKCLEVLDEALAGRDHMLASGFTAVDTAMGFSLYMGARFTSLGNYPNVDAYFGRLAARPAFQASEPAPDEPLRIYMQDCYGDYGR
jgi:glutathione S-transferase